MTMPTRPNYYERQTRPNTDGTPLFHTDHDKKLEWSVARQLELLWHCTIKPYGNLCPVDWYAERHGRPVGALELKGRQDTPYGTYPTVYLNVRKWLALHLHQMGIGTPSLFVVKWQDYLGFMRVDAIDTSRVKIGGCKEIVKSHTDIEPIIEVPVGQFQPLPQ